MSEFCDHGQHRGAKPGCTICSDEAVLRGLIYDAREKFEEEVKHGDWPETWDARDGYAFLAKFLMKHVIIVRP